MKELSNEERESIAVNVAEMILSRIPRDNAFDDIADALPFHSFDEVKKIHQIIVNRARVVLSD